MLTATRENGGRWPARPACAMRHRQEHISVSRSRFSTRQESGRSRLARARRYSHRRAACAASAGGALQQVCLNTSGVELMNVRPLHDRIVVRRLEDGEQNVGGIIIPDTAKEKPQRGTVIAAGSGTVRDGGTRVPLDVKTGRCDPVRQIYEPGDQARWRGLPHHARGRSAGRHRNRLTRRK